MGHWIIGSRFFRGELGDDAGDGGAGDVEAVGDGADREAVGVEAGDRADEFGAGEHSRAEFEQGVAAAAEKGGLVVIAEKFETRVRVGIYDAKDGDVRFVVDDRRIAELELLEVADVRGVAAAAERKDVVGKIGQHL